MKKLRYIVALSAIFIALLMSVDESISLYANDSTTHILFHDENCDASHHHTISIGDHFFQKNSISFSGSEPIIKLNSFPIGQPEFTYFLSSIWQPPKKSC